MVLHSTIWCSCYRNEMEQSAPWISFEAAVQYSSRRNYICHLGEIKLYLLTKILQKSLSSPILVKGGGAKLSKDSNNPSKNA